MRWAIGFVIAAALAVYTHGAVQAEMPVPPVPADGYVLDQTSTLQASEIQALNQTISDYRQQTRVQLAILIIPTITNDYLENYSLNVARTWGIGEKGKDNGALLLVVMRDHKLRIEVGRGLEGDLTDARAGQIIRNRITPHFKSGDYYGGIREGIDGMKLAINAADDPLAASAPINEPGSNWLMIFAIGSYLFIAVLSWFGAILGRSKRWWPGGLIGGGLGAGVGALLSGITGVILASALVTGFFGLLFDYLVSKNYRRAVRRHDPPSWWAGGGFPGGGGGFFGGGSSSGFGGGFGGGGFGGGGSSGDW